MGQIPLVEEDVIHNIPTVISVCFRKHTLLFHAPSNHSTAQHKVENSILESISRFIIPLK